MRTYNPGLRIRPPIRTRGILGGRGAGRGDGSQAGANTGWSLNDSFNYNETKVDYGALQRRETEIRDSYGSKTDLSSNADSNRHSSPSPLRSRDRARSRSRYRSKSGSRSPRRRSRSRSRSPGPMLRRRSRSRTPGYPRRRSRSRTPGVVRRRSRSRTPGSSRTPGPVRRRSRSPTSGKRRSRSPPSRRRSRSPPSGRRRSRTRSPARRRSRSPDANRARSPKRQGRPPTSQRPKSRSRSPEGRKRAEDTTSKNESSRIPTTVLERGREVIQSNSPALDKNIRVTVGNYSFEDKASASKISPLIEKRQGYKKENPAKPSLYGDSPIVKHSDHSPSPQLPSRISREPRKAPEFDMFYDETRDIRLRLDDEASSAHKFQKNPFAEIGAEKPTASKESRRDVSSERISRLPSHSPSPQPLEFMQREFKPPPWAESPTRGLHDSLGDGKQTKSILKKPSHRFADEDSSSRSGTLSGVQGYSFETAGKSLESITSTIIPGLGDLQGVEDEERFLYGDDADDEPNKSSASGSILKAAKKGDADRGSESGSPIRKKSTLQESPYKGLFKDSWEGSETRLSRERSPYRGFRQKSPPREKSPPSRLTSDFSPVRNRQGYSPPRGREMSPFRSRKDNFQFNEEFSLRSEERKQESSQFGDIFASLLRNRDAPNLLDPSLSSVEQDILKPASRSLEDVLTSLGFDFDMVRKFKEKAKPPDKAPSPEKDVAAEAVELYGIQPDMQVSSFFDDKDSFHKKANLGSSLSQNDAKPLEQWPGQYEHASAHQYHGHPPPVPDYPHMPFPVPPNYQTYPYGPDYYQYPPPGPFHGNYEGQPSFQNPPPFQNSAPFQGPPQFQGPPPIVNPVNPQLERPNLLVVPLQKDNSQTNTVSKNTSVQAPKPIKSDTVSSSKQREMASPAQAPGIKSALPSASELSKSQTQVLESKQSDALVIAVGRDEKIKRLHMLRKILERLRKEQGELMRKKQKQKDGHKDPLLLENSKLQEDILSQITSLHTAVAVEGEVLGKILTPYKVNVTEPTAPVLQQVPQHEKQVSKLEITVTPEVPKVASTNDAVECYYYDAGNHWCKQCNETFQNLKKLFQHLQSPDHLKNMDPAERPWKTDPNKQAAEQNKTKKGLYTAVKGSQFMVPCNILYCSLCKVFVGDELAAESHVKTKDHNVTYLSYVMEDNDYERSWDQTKAAALISKHKERKRRMLEEQEERDRKRRKAEEEEAKDKEKKRSNAMKKNQELIKAEAARNQPVDELDEASSSAAPSHKEPADLPKVKGKEIRLKLKEEKSSSVKDSSNVQTAEQPKSQDTGFGKFTWKKDNDSKTTEGPVDSKEDQVDADSKSQKIGSKIAIRLSGKTVIPPSIPWQTVPKSQGNKTSTIAPQISKKLPFVFPLRKTKLEPSKSSVPEQRTVAADYFGLAKDSCEPPPARVAANQKGASGFAPTHSDIANAFGGVFESSLKESNNVSPPGLQNIPLPSHDSNVNDGISSLKDVSNVAKDYKAEGDSIIVTKGMSAIVPKIPGADKVGSTGRLRESSLVVYGPTLPEGYVSMPPEGTNLSQFLSNPNLVSDNKNPHQSLPKVQDIKKTTVRKSYGPFLPENYDCRPPGEDPVYLVPSEKTKIEKTCSVSTNSNLSGSVSSSNAGGTLVTGTSQFKKPEVKSIASAAGSRPTVPKKTPAVVGINLNKSVGNRPKMQAVNKPTSPNKKVAPVKAPIAVKNVRPVSSPTTNKNTVNQPTTAKLLQGSVKVPAAEGTHNLASSVGATKLPKLLPHKVAPNVEESKKEMPTDDKKEMATKPDFSESAASKLENTGNKEMQSETSDVVELASKMEVNEEYINKKITHSDESSDPKGTDGVDAVKAQTLADCVVADGNSTEKLVQSSSTGETFAMEKGNSSVSEQNATLLRLDLVKGSGETKTAEATVNMSFCAKTIHLSQEEDSKLGLVPSETDGLNNLSEGVSTARTKELTDTEVPESTVESSMAVAAVVPKDGITSCSDQIPAASNVTSVVSSKLDEKHKSSSAPCTDEEKDKVQKPLIISVGGNTKNKNVQEMEKELMATNTPGVTADSIHITEAVDMTGQSFESSISDKKSNLPGEDTPTKAVSQNVEDEASKCVNIAVGEDSKLVESFSCVDSEKHKLEKTMLARKTKSQAELHTEKKEVPTKAVVENPIKTEEAGTSINVGIPSTVSVSKDAGKMKTEEKTVEQATDAEVTAKRKTSNSGPKPLRTTAVRAASKLQKRESQTAKNRSTNTDEHKETVCVDCSVVLTDILQCGPKGNTAACTNVITSEKTTVLGKREVNKESCVQDEVICNVGDNQVGKNELDEDQIDGEVQQNKRKRLEKDSPINTEQVHSAMCAGSENLDEHNSKKTTKICDSTCEAEINTNTCVAPVSERCMPLLTVETRATKRVFENSETFDNSNLAEDSSVEQLTKKLCQEISNIEASSAPPTLEKEVTAISDGLTNNKASDNSTLVPELEAMPSAARIENNVTLPVNSEVADKEIGNLGGTPDVTNACISALHDAAVSVAAVLESVASDGVSATAEEARSADGQMKPDSKRDGQEDSNSARGFTSDAESVVTDYNVNAGNDLVVLDETLYDTE